MGSGKRVLSHSNERGIGVIVPAGLETEHVERNAAPAELLDFGEAWSAVYAVGVRVMKPRPHLGGSAPPPPNRL